MEAAGIAPAAPIHQVVLSIAVAKSAVAPWSEICGIREVTTLDVVEMVIRRPSLPSPIVHAALAPARSPFDLVSRWIAQQRARAGPTGRWTGHFQLVRPSGEFRGDRPPRVCVQGSQLGRERPPQSPSGLRFTSSPPIQEERSQRGKRAHRNRDEISGRRGPSFHHSSRNQPSARVSGGGELVVRKIVDNRDD